MLKCLYGRVSWKSKGTQAAALARAPKMKQSLSDPSLSHSSEVGKIFIYFI